MAEKSGIKTTEVLESYNTAFTNSLDNYIFGPDRHRKPFYNGVLASTAALTSGLIGNGLTLPLLATPAGLPILGATAAAGLLSGGLTYLTEKRHKNLVSTMPTADGEKKVNVGFFEWINNGVGDFFLGKKRQMAPVFSTIIGGIAGAIGTAAFLPMFGPAAPAATIALGSGISAAFAGINASIFGVRRFKTAMPTAA
jgi:hypothetical protein